jgi:hypothetical protein
MYSHNKYLEQKESSFALNSCLTAPSYPTPSFLGHIPKLSSAVYDFIIYEICKTSGPATVMASVKPVVGEEFAR